MDTLDPPVTTRLHEGDALPAAAARLAAYAEARPVAPLSRHPAWPEVLRDGFGHDGHLIEADRGGRTVGVLPLAFVRSVLFGRFLVSLPYLNTAGVQADDAAAGRALIDRALLLADELRVRYLELRHEAASDHPALSERRSDKVHMRLALPSFVGQLWQGLHSKVRNQVRKAQKSGLTAEWGGAEKVGDFYAVFSRNMRDLGTPVYGRAFFERAAAAFPGRAEFCVVSAGGEPAAAALVLHGKGVSEVPSAACVRAFNPVCANMLLYWQLLERAVERGQAAFDFGRSTPGGNTYRFKKQWGAEAEPAVWQYHLREGTVGDMRPDHPRYRRAIRLWQRLPVPVTRLIGPAIVRGIP